MRPAYSRTVIGGVDAGECTFPIVKITTPGYVDSLKARLDTLFDDTNLGVQTCGAMTPDQRSRWSAFYTQWKAFAGTPSTLFGTSNLFDQTCAYAKQLDGWREIVPQGCPIPGPTHIESTNAGAEALASTLKWVAIASLAIGSAIVLASYAPEIKALLPGKR